MESLKVYKGKPTVITNGIVTVYMHDDKVGVTKKNPEDAQDFEFARKIAKLRAYDREDLVKKLIKEKFDKETKDSNGNVLKNGDKVYVCCEFDDGNSELILKFLKNRTNFIDFKNSNDAFVSIHKSFIKKIYKLKEMI